MHRRRALGAGLLLTALVGAGRASAAPDLAGQTHVVTAANRTCDSNLCESDLAGPWSVDDWIAVDLLTAVYNPPGYLGMYYDSPVFLGGFVLGDALHREIEGLPGMPSGAAFNVLAVRYADNNPCVSLHHTDSLNTFMETTYVSRPSLDDNASAFVLVQSETGPENVTVWYDDGFSPHWAISEEDGSPMPLSRDFLVWDGTCDIGLSALYRVTCNTTVNNSCVLAGVEHGNHNARLLVTQAGAAVHNPHNVGVYYNAGDKSWYVFNEDLAAMPTGAMFNVAVISVLMDTSFEGRGTEWDWDATYP